MPNGGGAGKDGAGERSLRTGGWCCWETAQIERQIFLEPHIYRRTGRIRSKREQKRMDTPSPLSLAAAVLTAPGWVSVGIVAASERLRDEATLGARHPDCRAILRPLVVVDRPSSRCLR